MQMTCALQWCARASHVQLCQRRATLSSENPAAAPSNRVGTLSIGTYSIGTYLIGTLADAQGHLLTSSTKQVRPMITVHHLNNSRSQRIIWLLEELGVPYEIKRYERDAKTNLAPAELKAVHPLGKSPMIQDGPHTIIESGAIVDYLIRRHGHGALQPDPASATYDEYVQWLHFAEGSAMLPLMLNLYVGRLGDAGAPLHPRIESELENYLGYLNTALSLTPYLVGEELTGADVQMSFVGELAKAQGKLDAYPHLSAWVERLQARPAYQKAIEQGGEYKFAK